MQIYGNKLFHSNIEGFKGIEGLNGIQGLKEFKVGSNMVQRALR